MRGKRTILAGTILVMLGAGWWLLQPAPIAVPLLRVEPGLVERVVVNTRSGTVTSCQRSRLSFKRGGQVSRRPVHEGDRVAAGALLLELDAADQRAQISESAARLEAVRLTHEQSCQQMAQDQRDLARVRHLAERRLASLDELDRAQTRARISSLICQASDARINEAKANLELQQALLDQLQLRAPFAGVVAEINGEQGEYVTPSPPGIPTPPAIDLIDDSCLYVEAPIDEVDAAQVRPGMQARITLDAFAARRFTAEVRRIAPFVRDYEKQARTVDIDLAFTEIDLPPLLAGYSADVEIILEAQPQRVRIPTELLQEGNRVLRLDRASGRLEAVEVVPGLSNWSFTEIRSGLAAGDLLLGDLAIPDAVAGARVEARDD